MIVPPTPDGNVVALSVREGAWLALLGSLTMVGAGLWPRFQRFPGGSESPASAAWSGLSGWTPGG
jgi:hypothetical protein